jgi:geranylgeranylglycerol-phosphate geranylgeranyltransferase
VRLEYSVFSGLAVFLSGVLAGDLTGFQLEYLTAFFVVLFSAVGAFAFNDYCDYEVDKRNVRSDRPLTSGLFPRRLALLIALATVSLAILLSLFLNLLAMVLVVASLLLLFLYSLGLKKLLLVKNVLVAYAYVATIFLGALVTDGVLEPLIVYFALMGFIVGLAVEIMLDIGDVEGDRVLGIVTVAARFGPRSAARVAAALYAVIMVLDPLPFLTMIAPSLYLDVVFLLLVSIPVTAYFFISRSLIGDQSRSTIFQLRNIVFVTMQAGCIAYLVGVLL